MRLPDPNRSAALLIGTATYESPDLDDLPGVANNLRDLAACLTDVRYGGLRADRCMVLQDPADLREVYTAISMVARSAVDMLLVYFAGHGRTGPRNELYLTLTETDVDQVAVTALRHEDVRELFDTSPANHKVLIIDSCFSGRAIADMGGPDALISQLEVQGTFTLTSTPPNQVALAPKGQRHTAFTGELITLLRTGIPDGPEMLSLDDLYRQLLFVARQKSLPEPRRRILGFTHELALTRNPAYRKPSSRTPLSRSC